jgi:hypothetical protein
MPTIKKNEPSTFQAQTLFALGLYLEITRPDANMPQHCPIIVPTIATTDPEARKRNQICVKIIKMQDDFVNGLLK